MELRHIRYFVAVAEELNFRKAAERLHISQPPLSAQIKQLEEEMGVKLFERTNRSVALTLAGQVFLERSYNVLDRAEQAVSDTQRAEQGQIGTLKVGFVGSAVLGVLQQGVKNYKKHYPDVDIQLKQSTNTSSVDMIENGDLDLSIVRTPLDFSANMKLHVIREEDYWLAVPSDHSLAKKKAAHINDVQDEPLVMFARHIASIRYDQVLSIYHDHGLSPTIVQEAAEQMTVMGLVASGIGISIVPEVMMSIEIPNISYIRLKDVKQKTSLAALTGLSVNVLTQNFLDLL